MPPQAGQFQYKKLIFEDSKKAKKLFKNFPIYFHWRFCEAKFYNSAGLPFRTHKKKKMLKTKQNVGED